MIRYKGISFFIGLALAPWAFAQVQPSEKKAKPREDTAAVYKPEAEFWNIIGQSVQYCKDSGFTDFAGQLEVLDWMLGAKSETELKGYHCRLSALMDSCYRWDIWNAGAILHGGLSDDGMHYFQGYLIAQGKEKFYSALKDPDSMADWVNQENEPYYEGMDYLAVGVLLGKFNISYTPAIKSRIAPDGTPAEYGDAIAKYPKCDKSGGEHAKKMLQGLPEPAEK